MLAGAVVLYGYGLTRISHTGEAVSAGRGWEALSA
jgi:hypothetical protein